MPARLPMISVLIAASKSADRVKSKQLSFGTRRSTSRVVRLCFSSLESSWFLFCEIAI